VTEESDGRLLERIRAGEREKYATLVERYRGSLGRYALRMLGNRADAEEALQDTFVRAYRSLDNCIGDGFGPWVFGILVNRCRTYGARRARSAGVVVTDDLAVAGAAVPHPAAQAALRDTIDWAMAQLPSEQREAFLLKHVEDLSYERMEAITGVGGSALRMRVLRAREALRKLLVEELRD